MPDRREPSGFRDPRYWLAFAGLLMSVGMTVGLAILSGIYSKLSTIESGQQALLVSTTRQGESIEALRGRVAVAENAIEAQKTAFNLNFTTRLAELKARLDTIEDYRKDNQQQNKKE